jgi:hypothetical protein
MQLMHNIGALQLCIFEDSELSQFRDARQQLLQHLPRDGLLRAKLVRMRMKYDEWQVELKESGAQACGDRQAVAVVAVKESEDVFVNAPEQRDRVVAQQPAEWGAGEDYIPLDMEDLLESKELLGGQTGGQAGGPASSLEWSQDCV